ncbi:MAG: hypothetical protein KAI47_09115, partial [Deltaproteobacteria bacterium]|nr:hypothetical protein [Deltaproteobacteria bacterium]
MMNRVRGLWGMPSLALSAVFFGVVLLSPSAWANDEPGSPGASGGGATPSTPSTPSTPGADQGTPSASSILSGGQGAPTPPLGGGGGSASKGFSGTAGGGAAFEALNGDYFLRLDLATALSFGPVKLGVSVPLRFRVIDKDPQNDGVFRSEDWDEVSDWARIIRFVEVNLGGDAWRFRGRFGSLDGESIGHGTIVGGYYNNIDANHYQAGLALNVAIKYGGIEFMLDNLLRPEVFAFRVHVRPTSFFTDNRWANKLIVATSFAADARAPVALVDRTTPGSPTMATPDGVPDVDGETNFIIDDRTTLGVWGLDVEYELLRNKIVDLVPYADLNLLFDDGAGVGFHLGFFFNVRIPIPIIKPVLLTRMEYRAIGDGYAPRYFDSIYEAQRYAYAPGVLVDPTDPNSMPKTKVGWLRTASTGANGWLGELYFDFAGIVRIGGSYEDYTGPNNSALTLALLLPALKIVQAGAYFSNRG